MIFAVIVPVPLVLALKVHGLEPWAEYIEMLLLQFHDIVAPVGRLDIEYDPPLAHRVEGPEMEGISPLTILTLLTIFKVSPYLTSLTLIQLVS